MLVDIDHFKRVNDSLGHHRGDEVLTALAALLQSHLAPQDAAVRWGGEEFLLILTGRDPPEARAAVRRIVEAVREYRVLGLPPVTVSWTAPAPPADRPAVFMNAVLTPCP